jgi:putative addiction module antidote
MTALKLTQIGNSVGLILPKELLARLRLERGGTVFLTKTSDGAVMMTPYDANFEVQMAEARKIMKRRRQVLRELARWLGDLLDGCALTPKFCGQCMKSSCQKWWGRRCA